MNPCMTIRRHDDLVSKKTVWSLPGPCCCHLQHICPLLLRLVLLIAHGFLQYSSNLSWKISFKSSKTLLLGDCKRWHHFTSIGFPYLFLFSSLFLIPEQPKMSTFLFYIIVSEGSACQCQQRFSLHQSKWKYELNSTHNV